MSTLSVFTLYTHPCYVAYGSSCGKRISSERERFLRLGVEHIDGLDGGVDRLKLSPSRSSL